MWSDRNSLKLMTLESDRISTCFGSGTHSLVFKVVSLETLLVSTAEARSRCSDMSSEMLRTHENHENHEIPNPVKLGSEQIPV